MKPISKFTIILAFCVARASSCESATLFQNLSFEAGPTLPLVPEDPLGYARYSISRVMPGWSAYLDNVPLNLVAYNNPFLSSAGVTLFGPPPPFPGAIIEGRY